MSIDDKYMWRCLQLAQKGKGYTAPNPLVGSVIVSDNKVIGEGWHQRYGDAHAEVNAVKSVKNRALLSNSVMYVTLEPCAHYGKTPPCAELIVKSGIPKVVVATVDPNPQVAGQGIEMLRRAGIEVVVGVLEKEARALNKIFFVNQQQKRPFVVLKWAQTANGFIDRNRKADSNEPPLKLSNELSAITVHQLRTQIQAIMVGTNTALLDDPKLTSRLWFGKNPIRIVIDRNEKLSENAAIFNADSKVIVVTQSANYKIKKGNILPLVVDFNENVNAQVLKKLYDLDISSLLVEGGSILLNSFIEKNLWDEAFVEIAPDGILSGIRAPSIDLKSIDYKTYHNNIRFHLKNATTQKFI